MDYDLSIIFPESHKNQYYVVSIQFKRSPISSDCCTARETLRNMVWHTQIRQIKVSDL